MNRTPELFGVNVRGPDDIIATRDYPEAVALAQHLNAMFAEWSSPKNYHEYNARMWAIPGAWQNSAEGHAENLAVNGGGDYEPMLIALRDRQV